MRGRLRLPLILGMVVLVPGYRASSASSEHVKMPFPAFFIAMLLGLALVNKHRGKFEIDVGLDTQNNRSATIGMLILHCSGVMWNSERWMG